jgi:hypothetical protein
VLCGTWEEGEVVLVVAAAVAVAADTVATRVIHMSDIDAADYRTVGNVVSETMVGTRGEGEGMQAGSAVV